MVKMLGTVGEIMFSRKYILRCAAFVLLLTVLCGTFLTAGAEDYAGHFLLSDKDIGLCRQLTGDVVLTVVFVDLPDAPFDQESQQQWTANVDAAMEWLEHEAEQYGAQLALGAQYYSVHVDEEAVHIGDDVSGWVQAVLAADPALPSYRPGEDTAMGGPVLFIMNVYGRAAAYSNPDENILEYFLLYKNSETRSVCHELMHLYGAWDYYAHDEVAQAAEKNLMTSIMLSADQDYPVDSLTAYVIGWAEELDAVALAMLADTAHLTEEDIGAAASAKVQDGYQTEITDVGVYTGQFQDGMYHGWGRMEWHSGDTYEGEWQFGVRTGVGIMTWADEAVYSGDFVNGTYHGRGCLQMTDGSVYTGSFVNGQFTGYGQKTWPDGSMYIGDFVNGTYHGRGCLQRTDGTVYSGSFVNGAQSGQGSILWPGGIIYIGEFVNGKRTGQGRMVWPDGSIYCGAFLDGSYHGYGVLEKPDGQRWEGQWENGTYIGQ